MKQETGLSTENLNRETKLICDLGPTSNDSGVQRARSICHAARHCHMMLFDVYNNSVFGKT